MRTLPLLALAAASLTACAHLRTPNPAELQPLLLAQTQALADANSVGNSKVWDELLLPEMVYTAEDGSLKHKADLLKEVQPFPPSISGEAKIVDLKVIDRGELAVTTYDTDEKESYFGHDLRALYRGTDVWQHTPQGWRLLATQMYAVLQDPPAITLAPAQLDAYVGSYALNADVTYEIRRQGEELLGRRVASGKPGKDAALLAEAPDVFFVTGQPRSRKVFQRGPSGRITGFADGREGRDVPWVKR